MSDKVSIIMPCYNSAAFVAESIKSVINQEYNNWELIICDDASTDDSVAIIKVFQDKDSRIRLTELKQNRGAAIARNTAIAMAAGRYIAFLDSDDLWLAGKLQHQVNFMKKHGAVLSYTHYDVMTEGTNVIARHVTPPTTLKYTDLLKSNQIGCLTAIYDAEQLGKVMMPDIRKRQDYGLWLSILKQGHTAIGLQKVCAVYRERSGSISSNKINLIKYNWKLFKNVEQLGFIRSAYYIIWNIYRKLRP